MAARPWQWNVVRSTVAVLLGVGKSVPEAVAIVRQDGHKLTTRTVENWLKIPDFVSGVESHRLQLTQRVEAEVIEGSVADRLTRLALLDRMARGMTRVMDRRAVVHAGDVDEVAGVETGLVEVVTQRQYDKDGNQVGEQVFGRVDHRWIGNMVAVVREAGVQAGDVVEGTTIQTVVNLEVGPEGSGISSNGNENESGSGNSLE